jgi:hypothetical protein
VRLIATGLLAAAVLAFAAVLGFPTVARAEDPEICGRVQPTNLPSVQGFAWTGTVTGLGPGTTIVFSVDHVYANTGGFEEVGPVGPFEAGSPLSLGNTSCQPITGLVVGRRYLVSTRAVGTAGPTTGSTVIWRIRGSELSFHHMYRAEFHLPPELAAAHTLPEALALVAPGAVIPPTDAAERSGPRPSDSVPWMPLVFGALVGLALMLKPRLLRRAP